MKPGIAAAWCVHDDHWYLAESIRSYRADGVEPFAFVSKTPWHSKPGDWEQSVESAREAGATVEVGEWGSEDEHRRAIVEAMKGHGFEHLLTPDGDETIEARLLKTLVKIAQAGIADRVYVEWDTYWKSPEYVIRPRERFTPLILVNLEQTEHDHLRNFKSGRGLFLSAEHGVIHHLSYVGPDERIERKIKTWSHKDELVDGWWERVWRGWDADRLLRNLHPTHPEAYQFAERIHVPDELISVAERFEVYAGSANMQGHVDPPTAWPTVSVVIPVCFPEANLESCLKSLKKSADLITETVVIANGCKKQASKIIKRHPKVKLIANNENRGFAAACNQGIEASTGEVVLFLNDDTVVPRAGLIELVRPLTTSGVVAATGPYTNRCGHFQQIVPTCTSLDTLELYAEDFAVREVEDVESDMLVGFCLAVRRSVLSELGNFDERFGLGTFEDNDLCYRLRRAGYKLLIAARSFVHHEGSASLGKVQADVGALLSANERVYRHKWQRDLDMGFASNLSGLTGERVQFKEANRPEKRLAHVRMLAKQADISLCMIVRNEERVLKDCLESAAPFFNEMIVVDTGSTDRTKEIAEELGARVYDFPWIDDFSAARNESLKHAKGKWIFWMDADDTLPWQCGEELLRLAIESPKRITSFIVPAQFVEEGPGSGTRVDHIKLFRRFPGMRFEHRIHEQILPSINEYGGMHTRSSAYVLHSGYDTSPEGQARKAERDWTLLRLDFKERPRHPFTNFNIGMTYHFSGKHKQAILWLRRCLKLTDPSQSIVRKTYAMLAISTRQIKGEEAALELFEEGLKVAPDDPELLYQQGHSLVALGKLEEAKQSYERVLQQNIDDHLSSVDVGIVNFKAQHALAGAHRLDGDYKKAKDSYLKVLEAAPHFTPSAFELFDAALEIADFATARDMLGKVQRAEGPSNNWLQMTEKYADSVGGEANVIEALRSTVNSAPGYHHVRMALCRKLLNAGMEGEAVPHLHLLAEAGKSEAAFYLGVIHTRRGQYRPALAWMERALALAPGHEATIEQVEKLRQMVSNTEEGT